MDFLGRGAEPLPYHLGVCKLPSGDAGAITTQHLHWFQCTEKSFTAGSSSNGYYHCNFDEFDDFRVGYCSTTFIFQHCRIGLQHRGPVD